MVNHLAETFATKMVIKKIIDIDDKECYVYGLELLISKIIVFGVILVISIITQTIIPSIIFTSSYIFLRQYSGGYHCKTAEMCMLVSIFIYLIFLITLKLSLLYLDIYLLGLSAISYFIVLLFSPLADANKEIDDDEKKKYKTISLIFASIMMLTIVICFFINIHFVFISVSCSLIADAILLLMAIIKRRRKRYADENNCKVG